jgi:hypothetical protein
MIHTIDKAYTINHITFIECSDTILVTEELHIIPMTGDTIIVHPEGRSFQIYRVEGGLGIMFGDFPYLTTTHNT